MKAFFLLVAFVTALALGSPLQALGSGPDVVGNANQAHGTPDLIEWGSDIVQDGWTNGNVRRSAQPQEYGSTVTIFVTTETITASASMPETTTDAATTAPASTSTPAMVPVYSWDWAEGQEWVGDQPANITYAKPVLDAHNVHRANHSTVNLKWNTTMEQTAKQISETCVYAHSNKAGDGNYGQNIGAGFPVDKIAIMVNDFMYNDEIELYPGPYGQEPDMTNFEQWGHYSQIVWKDTTDVGCWTTDCSTRGGLQNIADDVSPQFTVCNYYPAGNVVGSFGAKVPSPGTLPSVVIPQS